MAVMHPPQLSEQILGNPRLRGEAKVYGALAAMPDEYEVFYNRSVSRDSSSRAYSRRIDFIVLHEKLGLLAIEVKGGKIRVGQDGEIQQFHPSKDRWARINPYKQVELSTIELIRNAKSDGANYYIVENTCVIFPDTLRRDITDTPNLLPNGTLCADDLQILSVQIKTLFSKTRASSSWNRASFLDMRRRLNNIPESTRGYSEEFRNSPRSHSHEGRNRKYYASKSERRGAESYVQSANLQHTPKLELMRKLTPPVGKAGVIFNKVIDKALLVSATVLVMFIVLIAVRKL